MGTEAAPRQARVLRTGMLRRSRALMVSPKLWKSRLVFWVGALATGVISAAFAFLADEAHRVFGAVTGGGGLRGYIPLILTPAGMMACAWVANRYFPGSQGSGIPQAIAARHLRDDKDAMCCCRSGWRWARSC